MHALSLEAPKPPDPGGRGCQWLRGLVDTGCEHGTPQVLVPKVSDKQTLPILPSGVLSSLSASHATQRRAATRFPPTRPCVPSHHPESFNGDSGLEKFGEVAASIQGVMLENQKGQKDTVTIQSSFLMPAWAAGFPVQGQAGSSPKPVCLPS